VNCAQVNGAVLVGVEDFQSDMPRNFIFNRFGTEVDQTASWPAATGRSVHHRRQVNKPHIIVM